MYAAEAAEQLEKAQAGQEALSEGWKGDLELSPTKGAKRMESSRDLENAMGEEVCASICAVPVTEDGACDGSHFDRLGGCTR